jgi:hypothetical protein
MDVGISGDHEVVTDYVTGLGNYWTTLHMRWAVTRELKRLQKPLFNLIRSNL